MIKTAAVPRATAQEAFEQALGRVYPEPAPGLDELLRLPFTSADAAGYYDIVQRLAAQHRWPLLTEYTLCFWCFYAHMCLRRGHHETSIWDAVAATSHNHPESLQMMPVLWSLSDVFGMPHSDLPWRSDLTSGLIRTAWSFTELEDRVGPLSKLSDAERSQAWQFVSRLGKSPIDLALAAGIFAALAGDVPS